MPCHAMPCCELKCALGSGLCVLYCVRSCHVASHRVVSCVAATHLRYLRPVFMCPVRQLRMQVPQYLRPSMLHNLRAWVCHHGTDNAFDATRSRDLPLARLLKGANTHGTLRVVNKEEEARRGAGRGAGRGLEAEQPSLCCVCSWGWGCAWGCAWGWGSSCGATGGVGID
jgi:hypothetical protein